MAFLLNGLSFIAVIVALAMMDIKPQLPRARPTSALADLKEGLRYTATHPTIRLLIIVATVTNDSPTRTVVSTSPTRTVVFTG